MPHRDCLVLVRLQYAARIEALQGEIERCQQVNVHDLYMNSYEYQAGEIEHWLWVPSPTIQK